MGSIILPSFINSAVGIKPTRGLVSRGGVIPLLPQKPMGSMADVVAFNRRGGREAVRFGQKVLVEAESLTPADKRRAKSRLARVKTASREAMLAPFGAENLDALVVSLGASSITNTTAGFPAVTVPAGYIGTDPYGVVFTGRRWSEPSLIGYAYAYEQATQRWRSPATINPNFAAACAS